MIKDTINVLTYTPRLIPNSDAGYHGVILTSATSKKLTPVEERSSDNRGKICAAKLENPLVEKNQQDRSRTFLEKKNRRRIEKRKTRRLGAGQSYCTMFTSSTAPNDHDGGAHARARDPAPSPSLSFSPPRLLLCPSLSPSPFLSRHRFPSRPAFREPTAATYNLGRLRVPLVTARGGCRRGRRLLVRACTSPLDVETAG